MLESRRHRTHGVLGPEGSREEFSTRSRLETGRGDVRGTKRVLIRVGWPRARSRRMGERQSLRRPSQAPCRERDLS